MPVKVRCTGCEKVLTAPDSARGKAIRCPACETKVKVPAGGDAKAAKSGKKPAKPAADSDDMFASLDLRNLEDRDARICGKCGYDLKYQDEDDTECPKCGYDSSTGGLGTQAQKKRLKGPDPDKFYEGLWNANWKFAIKNQILALRTMAYTLIASLLMFLCLFLYLYIPMWPPRVFFALCTFVAGMMIPGWLWFLDQELAVASLQKKDKLKRINFDFFLCSALGVKFLVWNVVFALPIVAIPALIGYVLTEFGGSPDVVLWVFVAIGYLPVLAMMPICIGHFVMPVQTPGWMFWKVLPVWFRTLKPTVLWVVLTLVVHLPTIGCLATIAAVYGEDIQILVEDMDENAAIARVKRAHENASDKEKAAFNDNPLLNMEFHEIDYGSLIVPGVLWVLACAFLGYPALYSCRVNGQFLYFFRESLDLIFLEKQYKYVAKEKTDEDDDMKPPTHAKLMQEGALISLVISLLGLVGGMLYGSAVASDGDIVGGMLVGTYFAAWFSLVVGNIMLIVAGFKESPMWGLIVWFVPFGFIVFAIKFLDQAIKPLSTFVTGFATMVLVAILAVAGLVDFNKLDPTGGGGNPQQQVQPVDAGMDAMPAMDGAMPE